MITSESKSGRLTGPWVQQPDLLFQKDGGHGMIFKTLDGRLMVTLHQPNSPTGAERMKAFELQDTGNTLVIKKYFF